MKRKFFLRSAIRIWTLMIALGLVPLGHAQNNALATLDAAYSTLAQADHDYKGHRVRAMEQIKHAVHALGGKISGNGKGHEAQATSDAQLRTALNLLEQARSGVTGRASKHLNAAINQIQIALKIR